MNFIQTIFRHLREDRNRESLIEVRGKTLLPATGGDVLGWVGQVQRSLKLHEVQKGDRVALLAPNSFRWTAVDLALLSAGTISVPLYSRQEPKELSAMLVDSDPKLLICSDRELSRTLETHWKPTCKILHFDEIFTADPSAFVPQDSEAVASEDPVTIVYTSGTSGEPKGVGLTRANIDFALARTTSSLTSATGRTTNTDRVFHFLPLCFLGSRLMFWTQLYRGNPVMLSTDLKNIVEELTTSAPNYFLTVPAVLERIRNGVGAKLKQRGGFAWKAYAGAISATGSNIAAKMLVKALIFPKIRKQIGKNLEFVISGSAPLSPETQDWFRRIDIPILQVYGLTETTGIVAMDSRETACPGFVGRPIEGCEIQTTEDGELLVWGPNIFLGYWNRPEATAAIIRNGWLFTGDQAEVSPDGNLKIVGRMKNLLVPTSGHNVAPEPLELKIVQSCRGVEHAVVVGHGKPYLAVLITGSAEDEEISRALEALNNDVPHYRKIRKYARLNETFTPENGFLTANQKLRRRMIEENFRTTINSLYEGEA